MSHHQTAINTSAERPVFVSFNEAARLLSCGRSFIYLLVKRGELIGSKVGRRHLVLRSSIDDLAARAEASRR